MWMFDSNTVYPDPYYEHSFVLDKRKKAMKASTSSNFSSFFAMSNNPHITLSPEAVQMQILLQLCTYITGRKVNFADSTVTPADTNNIF
jgi:hypothetical protein